MPILLTASHRGYGEVKVIGVRIENEHKRLFVKFQYGDTVSGKWVPGELQVDERLFQDREAHTDGEQEISPAIPAYTDLIKAAAPKVTFQDKSGDANWAKSSITHPTKGEIDVWVQISYRATSDNLYTHAITKGWFPGTIQ